MPKRIVYFNQVNALIVYFFVRSQCTSKKKKKGHCVDGGIFFSGFMLIFKKKKKKGGPLFEFCKFSLQFVRHTRAMCCEPQLSTVFGVKQKRRFLAGDKTPKFAKFQCQNAGKNFALFALLCAYREHWWKPCFAFNVIIVFSSIANFELPECKSDS